MKTMKLIFGIFLLIQGCVSKRIPYTDTPYDDQIPEPSFFQTAEYEFRCIPYRKSGPDVLEKALNSYGMRGFRVAGFVVTNGQTQQLCLERKR